MFLPGNTSTSWTTAPYTSLPTSNATTSAPGHSVPSTKWSLWIILSLIVGLLGLFLAVPGCLHGLKQLRLRNAQTESGTEPHPVQQSPAELTTLEPVLKKDSVRSPRPTPPGPLVRGRKKPVQFLLNTVVDRKQISLQRLKQTQSVHSGEVMFVSA